MSWLLLAFSGVRSFLVKLPWQVWAGLAVAALVWWHFHSVSLAYKHGVRDTDKAWHSAVDAQHKATVAWHDAYHAASMAKVTIERDHYDQEVHRIANAAGSLRLSGPGAAAACGPRSSARVSSPASGPVEPAVPTDDPLAPVPAGEGVAVVPWTGLVNYGESHDRLLAEVTSWRHWYADQKALVDEARAALPSVEFAPPH